MDDTHDSGDVAKMCFCDGELAFTSSAALFAQHMRDNDHVTSAALVVLKIQDVVSSRSFSLLQPRLLEISPSAIKAVYDHESDIREPEAKKTRSGAASSGDGGANPI